MLLLKIIHTDEMGGGIFVKTLPRLVPMPLSDVVGTKPEVFIMKQSLNPGWYRDHLQRDSSRSYSTAYGNMWI